MSMFFKKFEKIMSRFGYEPRLAKQVKEAFVPGQALTFNQLVEKISPDSPSQLALLLADLSSANLLEQIIRVESPETHSGIEDFRTIEEVPKTIYDMYSDKYIDVTPANVVVLFKPSVRQ
jgi:hypothetical protein